MMLPRRGWLARPSQNKASYMRDISHGSEQLSIQSRGRMQRLLNVGINGSPSTNNPAPDKTKLKFNGKSIPR